MKHPFFRTLGVLLPALLLLALGCAAKEPAETIEAEAAASPKSMTAAPTEAPTAPPQPTPEPTPAPVTVLGQRVLADAETLVLEAPVSDAESLRSALDALPALKELTLTRTLPEAGFAAWKAEWADLLKDYPDVTFTLNDRYADKDAASITTLTLTAADGAAAEWNALLSLLPAVHTLRVAGTLPLSVAAEVAAANPTLTLRWTDAVYGMSDSADTALTLPEKSTAETALLYLGCFPHLLTVDLTGTALSETDGDALQAAFPAVEFHRTVTLNGTVYDNLVESLNLEKARIGDYDAFAAAVGRFPRLKHFELSGCSLTNEQLAALRERYPNAGIVWTVRFHRWSVRTDAIAFSTNQDGEHPDRQSASDVSALRYCTDLIFLDLGHNGIRSLEWLRPLTKLQALILADNWHIEDISVIGTLTQLKYLELFLVGVEDISPLANLPELLDVNLCITHVKDLSPLLSCPKLERIWIGRQTQDYCSKESLEALQTAFPDAVFDLVSPSCTARGWRDHDRFKALRTMLKTQDPIAPFLPEQ